MKINIDGFDLIEQLELIYLKTIDQIQEKLT